MKWYIQGDKNDPSTWKLSYRNHTNSMTVGEAPLDENGNPESPAWLELVDLFEEMQQYKVLLDENGDPVMEDVETTDMDGNPITIQREVLETDENGDFILETVQVLIGKGFQVNETLKAQVLADKAQKDLDAAWSNLRIERDSRLKQCDWTQLSDSPLTEAKKSEWAAYRQTLRDLPENTTDPENPIWPNEPS